MTNECDKLNLDSIFVLDMNYNTEEGKMLRKGFKLNLGNGSSVFPLGCYDSVIKCLAWCQNGPFRPFLRRHRKNH